MELIHSSTGWQKAVTQFSLAIIAATLLGLPWLFAGMFWCSWLGIALGLYLVTRTGWAASWWMTWLWCTLSIAIAFHWSPGAMAYTLSSSYAMGMVVTLPLVMWDGLRLALGFWLAARLTRNIKLIWLPAALIAMSLEMVTPSVFPWGLGLPQVELPWLVQPVALFGASWATLIAFSLAAICILIVGAIAEHWRAASVPDKAVATPMFKFRSQFDRLGTLRVLPFRIASGAGLFWLTALNVLFGLWSMTEWKQRIATAEKIRFALIQVDPSFTTSTERLQILTRSVAERADIVCWPESSGGNYELGLKQLSNQEQVFARSREPARGLRPWPEPKCELLLGGKCYVGNAEAPDKLFVTAMLINTQEAIADRYHKRFLMPFGEYVPGEKSVPGMAELFDMAEHIEPGPAADPIVSSSGARLGVMLCYEDMVPSAAAELANQEVDVLVSLINGSAFESAFTLSQHRLLSQLRAVECRKFLLRCAATGETCVISPLGEVVDRLPMQKEGSLVSEVAMLAGSTQFTRTPWLGTALTFMCLTWVAFVFVRSQTA